MFYKINLKHGESLGRVETSYFMLISKSDTTDYRIYFRINPPGSSGYGR